MTSNEPVDICILRSRVADLERETDRLRQMVAQSPPPLTGFEGDDPREYARMVADDLYEALETVYDDWAIARALSNIRMLVAALIDNAPLADKGDK